MGEDGFMVLVWKGFGDGLVRVNPTLHCVGVDSEGNPRNWWPCAKSDSDDDLLRRVGLPTDLGIDEPVRFALLRDARA